MGKKSEKNPGIFFLDFFPFLLHKKNLEKNPENNPEKNPKKKNPKKNPDFF